QNVLITRVDEQKALALSARIPALRHAPIARTMVRAVSPTRRRARGQVAVVRGGTSDMSVAEEPVETLEAVGLEPARFYDVGIAGIHRLFHRMDDLRRAAPVLGAAG